VPINKILSLYSRWQKPEDLNPLRLKTIAHFFEHYKDLEEGKWVKILGWEGPESARQEISRKKVRPLACNTTVSCLVDC
jgi:inorganic pyrophosphatase